MRIATLSTICLMTVAPALHAATVTSSFTDNHSASQSIFGGASSSAFDFDASLAGVINFSLFADSGTVNLTSSASKQLRYQDELLLSEAGSASFEQRVTGLRTDFSTSFGASAEADVSILGVYVPIIDEGSSVSTTRGQTTVSFGQTVSATGRDTLAGAAASVPLISPVISADVNVEQRSNHKVTSVSGRIIAQNTTTGTIRSQIYTLNSSGAFTFDLDLSEVGDWTLFHDTALMAGTFDADFGASATGTVGGFIGFNCGNVATDSDNGFGCVEDFGVSVTSPAAYFIDGSPFSVNYSAGSPPLRTLGSVNVLADPVAPSTVPLPAGVVLLFSGLGALAAFRRGGSGRATA